MKMLRFIVSIALMGALLATQTAYGAQPAEAFANAPVIIAGQENAPGNAGPGVSAADASGASGGVLVASPGSESAAPPGDGDTVLTPAAGPGEAVETAPQQVEAGRQETGQTEGRYIDPLRPMVALTFDDGPHPPVGNRIMDCLAQYGAKATFFMVGDRVASRAGEVQRMVREGHEVANHSMNHKYFQKLSAAEIQAQVTKCNDAIEAVCGVRPRIMRLPGGNYNSTVLANTHMPMIQWNIDTLDWKTKNADKTVAAVLNHVKDGDIILLHDIFEESVQGAVMALDDLMRRGYTFVTVNDLLADRDIAIQRGKVYRQAAQGGK